MKKKQTQPIPGHDEGACLTPEEAAAMVKSRWAGGQLDDDQSIGDFLLLIRSIAYTRESDEREEYSREIENILMPFAPIFDDAINELLSKRLAVAHSLLKEGGTQ